MTHRPATPRQSPRATRGGRGPVLFALDHDPSSLDALLSALSRRFGNDFTVSGETSPEAALGALKDLAAAGDEVALLLVHEHLQRWSELGDAEPLAARAARLADLQTKGSNPASGQLATM